MWSAHVQLLEPGQLAELQADDIRAFLPVIVRASSLGVTMTGPQGVATKFLKDMLTYHTGFGDSAIRMELVELCAAVECPEVDRLLLALVKKCAVGQVGVEQ